MQHRAGFYEKYVKRLLDLALSGMALIILSPLLLVTATLVRVSHAAELVELEDLLVLPRPLLAEDHRASQFDAHQSRRHKQQR